MGVNIKLMTDKVWVHPGALYCLLANTSKLFTKNKINSTLSNARRLAPTWKYLSPRSIVSSPAAHRYPRVRAVVATKDSLSQICLSAYAP